MTDLNRQIAEIDGYYLITCKKRPEDGEHWHQKGDGCCRFDPPPDYLDPENPHELVRVAVPTRADTAAFF